MPLRTDRKPGRNRQHRRNIVHGRHRPGGNQAGPCPGLRLVGQTNHPRVEEAEDYIIESHGIRKYPLITATNPKKYEELKAKGALLMTAFDTQFILKAFKEHLAGYKK